MKRLGSWVSGPIEDSRDSSLASLGVSTTYTNTRSQPCHIAVIVVKQEPEQKSHI